MSVCPKCNKKLRIFDVRQNCPACGVNMRFYGFEEQFYRDAKAAELSVAKIHVKLRVFKTAFVGGALPKARFALAFLPLLTLLLPAYRAVLTLPFVSKNIAMNILGIYRVFTDGTFGFASAMTTSSADGRAFVNLKNLLFAHAAVSVTALLALIFTLLCFLSVKKMAALLCATACLGAGASLAAAVLAASVFAAARSSNSPLLGGGLSFGLFVSIAAFAGLFLVNFPIARSGLPVEFEEGALERVEIARRVKRGEISLDDLPQPIVETAETRAIDEEILKEQERFAAKEDRKVEKV